MPEDDFCNDPLCDRVRKGEKHAAHDTSPIHQKKFESLKSLIGAGSDITGTTIGGIAGAAIGGPPGAAMGAAAGTLVSRVLGNIGDELSERMLGTREKVRIGAALGFAMSKIQENFTKGAILRDDDFFDDKPYDRGAYKEIVEGVLLAAQREYEEKKTRLYGNLLANIAFSPGIGRAHASLLIKFSHSLSYRQLCLLSIFGQRNKFILKQNNYRDTPTMIIEMISLLQEIFDLSNRGLIATLSGSVVLGLTDIVPANMKPEGEGETLFKLMVLEEIDEQDLKNVAQILR
jgi:hypothetical protein